MQDKYRRVPFLLGCLIGVAAMGVVSKCSGQELKREQSSGYLVAPLIELGDHIDPDTGERTVLRQTTFDGRVRVLSVDVNGNVVFSYNATIDFAGFHPGPAGPFRGYILVAVNGEPVLLPSYSLQAGGRKISDGR